MAATFTRPVRRFRSAWLAGIVIAAVLLTAWGIRSVHVLGSVGTANKAKLLCSAVFVSGRDPETVLAAELAGGGLDRIAVEIDRDVGRVTASLLWTRSEVVHRPGIGCTRVVGTDADALHAQFDRHRLPAPPDLGAVPWPMGDVLEGMPAVAFDRDALEALLDEAFETTAAAGTRAVAIAWRGALIAERHAPGFDRDMPLTGWSMTKSLTNALIGMRVGEGALDLDAPAPVPEWRAADDPRRHITLDQLLRASSGLDFGEVYTSLASDAVQMLFGAHGRDMGGFAAGRPLAGEPDTIWNYSSGTTNLLQRILRDSFEDLGAYHRWVRERLFHRIGMTRTLIHPDASGTLVGSSFGYGTARDWLRFGLLYLNDGVWEGERVLPEGWVAYSVRPTAADPQGRYGAQWWLNGHSEMGAEQRPWPSLPADAYRASGFEGQYLTIVPSRDLVVVRLGFTPDRDRWAMDTFVARVIDVLDAAPESEPAVAEDVVAGGEHP